MAYIREFSSELGSRQDVTSVDEGAVIAELSKGEFLISTTAGTYNPELLTTSYISSIFEALDSIENCWKVSVSQARGYIENFENIPLPESFENDSSFLDESEYVTPISASLNGVTSSLNVRAQPSTSSDKVDSVKPSDQISEVIGEVVDKDGKKWYKVKTSSGKVGYVSADYVTLNSQPNVISLAETETTLSSSSDSSTKEAFVNLDHGNSSLNIRSSPEFGNNVIGQLQDGDKVLVVESDSNDSWIKIKMDNGNEAYIAKEYVKYSNPLTEQPVAVDIPFQARVKTSSTDGRLNIRSSPDYSSSDNIVGQLDNNAVVDIIGPSEVKGWMKIKVDGEERYVDSQYLDI